MLRKLYQQYEYEEVETPQLFLEQVWKTSGHWDNYKENMFLLGEFGLKPMNCPAHCLMFGIESRSWRDLPVRYAEFGSLHR